LRHHSRSAYFIDKLDIVAVERRNETTVEKNYGRQILSNIQASTSLHSPIKHIATTKQSTVLYAEQSV